MTKSELVSLIDSTNPSYSSSIQGLIEHYTVAAYNKAIEDALSSVDDWESLRLIKELKIEG